jgi:hypothetical protein
VILNSSNFVDTQVVASEGTNSLFFGAVQLAKMRVCCGNDVSCNGFMKR